MRIPTFMHHRLESEEFAGCDHMAPVQRPLPRYLPAHFARLACLASRFIYLDTLDDIRERDAYADWHLYAVWRQDGTLDLQATLEAYERAFHPDFSSPGTPLFTLVTNCGIWFRIEPSCDTLLRFGSRRPCVPELEISLTGYLDRPFSHEWRVEAGEGRELIFFLEGADPSPLGQGLWDSWRKGSGEAWDREKHTDLFRFACGIAYCLSSPEDSLWRLPDAEFLDQVRRAASAISARLIDSLADEDEGDDLLDFEEDDEEGEP